MQGTIVPNQAYIDEDGIAHIFIALVEGQDAGKDIIRTIEVKIPAVDFVGKTALQRRALIVAAARAVEGRPPRAIFSDVSGSVTI